MDVPSCGVQHSGTPALGTGDGAPWGGIYGVMPTLNRQVLGEVFAIRDNPSLVPASTRHVGTPKGHREAMLCTQADTPKLAPL